MRCSGAVQAGAAGCADIFVAERGARRTIVWSSIMRAGPPNVAAFAAPKSGTDVMRKPTEVTGAIDDRDIVVEIARFSVEDIIPPD
jgi:hypothetical protein